jgi:hypothetical protein
MHGGRRDCRSGCDRAELLQRLRISGLWLGRRLRLRAGLRIRLRLVTRLGAGSPSLPPAARARQGKGAVSKSGGLLLLIGAPASCPRQPVELSHTLPGIVRPSLQRASARLACLRQRYLFLWELRSSPLSWQYRCCLKGGEGETN